MSFFPVYFSLWPKRNSHREKSWQKMFPQTQNVRQIYPSIIKSFNEKNAILAILIPFSEKSNDSCKLISLGASFGRQFFGLDR